MEGEMDHETALGIEEDDRFYRLLDRFWHPVAQAGELDAGPILVTLLERRLVIARINGSATAFDDRCPHRGASLSLGEIDGDCLRCSYHGWAYNSEGTVVEVPANPSVSSSLTVSLTRYRCETKNGLVWVSLTDFPEFDIPDFPHFDDPDFRIMTCDPYEWMCASVRRLENFVDFGHFAWIHNGILGTREQPEVGEHEIWREDGAIRCTSTGTEPPSPTMKTHLGVLGDLISVRNEYWISMPHSVLLDRHFDGGARYLLFMAACPIGPKQTRSFWFIGRNYALGPEADGEFLDFEHTILAQDQPVVESLTPGIIPSALGEEMYVKTADAITLGYRRWLSELAT